MYEDVNFNLSEVNFIKNIFNIVLKREPSSLEYKLYSNDLKRKCEDTLFLKKELLHRIINSDEYLSNFLLKKIYSDNKLNKICILLCGHWRNYEKYILQYDNFLKKNKNIDIFIHTWSEQEKNIFSKLSDSLNPKGMLIESNNDLLNSFNWEIKNSEKTIFGNIWYRLGYGDYSKYIISQIYGIYKCNELKKNYEKINNIKYDLVIKIRSDSFTDINIDMIKNINLSNDIIYTYNNQNHKHPLHGGGCAACVVNFPIKKCKYHQNLICDVMMYGSSESIDKLASMYLHTDSILKYFHIKNTDEMKKCNKFEHSHDMFFRTSNIESEELNFMCCYPEHFLRYFLKEIYIIPDPFKNVAEFK